MKLAVLALLVCLSTQLTLEINNIHYGFRNVYIGTARLAHTLLTISPYVELT